MIYNVLHVSKRKVDYQSQSRVRLCQYGLTDNFLLSSLSRAVWSSTICNIVNNIRQVAGTLNDLLNY